MTSIDLHPSSAASRHLLPAGGEKGKTVARLPLGSQSGESVAEGRMRGALRSVAVIVLLALGASAVAALSPKYADWPKGPEQWLMTRDDWRAWKNVKTDEEAEAFIALFWARRDPTPGTYLNEYRAEFEGRVEYADKNYKSERGKRGSLTEPGRVFVLLGSPKNAGRMGRISMSTAFDAAPAPPIASSGGSSGGGPAAIPDGGYKMAGTLGARMEWEYARPGELGLTGSVFFIEDVTSHEFHYDPQRSNVGGAITSAIQRAVVNPSLTSLPDWAKPPHIEYHQVEMPEPVQQTVVTSVPTAGSTTVKRGGKTVEQIITPAGAAGAHDLWLIADSRSIKPQDETNAFTNVTRRTSFAKADDIGFVFQYCRPAVDAVRTKLKFAILVSGKVGKDNVDIEVPEDETMAEPLKTMPGCSLVRGAIPASALQPGDYSFTMRITDPATSQSYNLASNFKIE